MMLTRAAFRKALVAAAGGVLLLLPAFSVGPTFIPDSTFKGSTLAGWHPLVRHSNDNR